MLDARTLKLTVAVAVMHVLLLVAVQAALGRRPAPPEPVTAVIADLFDPEPAPKTSMPEPQRQPDPPKAVRITRPTPAPRPKPAPVVTTKPEPGIEAVQNKVDTAHVETTQAVSAPAAAPAPAPAPVARVPAEAAPAAPAAPAGPRAVAIGEIQCSTPEPRYPLAARRLGEQGTVRVRLVIDENGAVERAELLSSSGSERLDRVALEAAQATRCRPYVADGRPIRVTAVRPFSFRLD